MEVSSFLKQRPSASHYSATNIYTSDKCRLRWFYLHSKRRMGKDIKYKGPAPSQTNNFTENFSKAPLPEESKRIEVIQKDESNKENTKPQTQVKTEVIEAAPVRSNVKIEEVVDYPEPTGKEKKSVQFNESLEEVHEISPNKKEESVVKQLLEQKEFKKDIPENVSLGDLEAHIWKRNIVDKRTNKDFLDISKEDFSEQTSMSVQGQAITPSNFNIFRDSLRETSNQLLHTLQENLPDMNLHEEEGDDSDDEDVVPLDFRTTYIEDQGKVVIQAKPMEFQESDEDDFNKKIKPSAIDDLNKMSYDNYLESVKRESFDPNDQSVIYIDPDINIKEKFDQIELACNKEDRINNQISAPSKGKKKSAPPQAIKQFKDDEKYVEPNRIVNPVANFDQILKDQGIDDLDDLLAGGSGIGNQSTMTAHNLKDVQKITKKPKEESKQESQQQYEFGRNHEGGLVLDTAGGFSESEKEEEQEQNAVSSGLGAALLGDDANKDLAKMMLDMVSKGDFESFLKNEKSEADKIQEDREKTPDAYSMLFGLQDKKGQQEDDSGMESSDHAPPSPLVDTEDEQRRIEEKRQKGIKKSVDYATGSASENEDKVVSTATESGIFIKPMFPVPSPAQIAEMKKQERLDMIKKAEAERLDPRAKAQRGLRGERYTGTYGAQSQDEQEDSDDSDDGMEDFAKQREMIRKKIIQNSQDLPPTIEKDLEEAERIMSNMGPSQEEERKWSDMEDFDQMMEDAKKETSNELEVARKEKEEQDKKAKDQGPSKQDSEREKILREQQDRQRQDQEKKVKERNELMEKLKKQDEESKKRKKEEREKKEREKALKQKIEQEKKRREEADRKRDEEVERKLKLAEEQAKRELVQMARRKENLESVIKESWNGSDIPCMFDSKISFTDNLSSIPVSLKNRIEQGDIDNNDIILQRYKCLTLPCGLGTITCTLLLEYFLKHSTLRLRNLSDSPLSQVFPVKLIGVTQTLIPVPFKTPSISIHSKTAIRGFVLLFDTEDTISGFKGQISECLAKIKVNDIVKGEIESTKRNFKTLIEEVHRLYKSVGMESPYGETAEMTENTTLKQIMFPLDYCINDDVFPKVTKEPFEFLTRYPTFWAHNPNKSGQTIQKQSARGLIVKSKFQEIDFENVVITFKDLAFKEIDLYNKGASSNNMISSLEFIMREACEKQNLDIAGFKFNYLTSDNIEILEKVFNKKPSASYTSDQAFITIVFRGADAHSKLSNILGHFNPEMARKTNEWSLRAFFGEDKDNNCAFDIKHAGSSKPTNLDLTFWMGGRVTSQSQAVSEAKEIANPHFVVTPPSIQKSHVFFSPAIEPRKLGVLLSAFNKYEVNIIDLQYIDYSTLLFEREELKFPRSFDKRIREKYYTTHLGIYLKVVREDIYEKLWKVMNQIKGELFSDETNFEDFVYWNKDQFDYQNYRRLVRSQFKCNFAVATAKQEQKKAEGTEEVEVEESKQAEEEEDDIQTITEQTFELFESLKGKFPVSFSKRPYSASKPTPVKSAIKEDSNDPELLMMFMKFSTFKHYCAGDILTMLLDSEEANDRFELVGMKVIHHKDTRRFNEENKNLIKTLFYKFYENSFFGSIEKKIRQLKGIIFVLRKRNPEKRIEQFYDKTQLTFLKTATKEIKYLEQDDYLTMKPSCLFLTNKSILEELGTFMTVSKFIKLFNDFSYESSHYFHSDFFIRSSPVESDQIDTQLAKNIKSFTLQQDVPRQNFCCVVVKPNQPSNVLFRALKTFANKKLSVAEMQLRILSGSQIDHLFKHDIELDDEIGRPEKYKDQFENLFKNNLVHLLIVEGKDAIYQVNQIMGRAKPRGEKGDQLRQYYGKNRVENGFYCSLNYQESLDDIKVLFEGIAVSPSVDGGEIERLSPCQFNSKLNLTEANFRQQTQGQKMELVMVAISPTAVSNQDFIYILEDFTKCKFNLCQIQRLKMTRNDVNFLFEEQKRFLILDVLTKEFEKGETILCLFEREFAYNEAHKLIGKFEIKGAGDFEKPKKKQSSTGGFGMFGGQQHVETLIADYGGYIYTFGSLLSEQQPKIQRYFDSIHSKNFEFQN